MAHISVCVRSLAYSERKSLKCCWNNSYMSTSWFPLFSPFLCGPFPLLLQSSSLVGLHHQPVGVKKTTRCLGFPGEEGVMPGRPTRPCRRPDRPVRVAGAETPMREHGQSCPKEHMTKAVVLLRLNQSLWWWMRILGIQEASFLYRLASMSLAALQNRDNSVFLLILFFLLPRLEAKFHLMLVISKHTNVPEL